MDYNLLYQMVRYRLFCKNTKKNGYYRKTCILIFLCKKNFAIPLIFRNFAFLILMLYYYGKGENTFCKSGDYAFSS